MTPDELREWMAFAVAEGWLAFEKPEAPGMKLEQGMAELAERF